VQDSEDEIALQNSKKKPLVIAITDSQVGKRIAAKTPVAVKLTTFSTI
jgi:hypothetical protein